MSTRLVPESLQRTQAALLERQGAAEARFAELSGQVAIAKQRVAWQPEVGEVLDVLQEQEHQRAVGVFERLLGSLLREVLPGERDVVFDLHTERNLPALDVFVRKGAGQPLEDPYSGGGGSVTNVLSAGLRMIALVRSGMRPFLVLDEPDCWLKPEYAPAFARVIQEASQNLGIQVLFVSHHDEAHFDGILPHRLFLERTREGLRAAWRTHDMPQWDPAQPGIRSILLEHCQSHTQTFLPLAPGVTYLCGDNDIGKSVIPMALRSMFYGGANDTLIQHHAGFAQVTVDFGPEKIVRWRRNAKGKDKEVYTLIDPASGEAERSTVGARALPTWLAQFGIAPIDGLDVQLGHQKKPVFLLDLSAHQRAKVLAIGSEAGHVQSMMALDRQDLTEAKAAIKAGEKELEALYRRRRALQPVLDHVPQWEALLALGASIEGQREAMARERELMARWQAAEDTAARARGVRQEAAPAAPAWRAPLQPLRSAAGRWDAARQVLGTLGPVRQGTTPAAPRAPTTPQMAALTRRWAAAAAIQAAGTGLGKAPPPAIPAAPRTPAIKSVAARWVVAEGTRQCLAKVRSGEMPAPPAATFPLRDARRLASTWAGATQRCTRLSPIRTTRLPDGQADAELPFLRTLQVRWSRAAEAGRLAAGEIEATVREECDIAGFLDGQECPTCKQPYHQTHTREGP